MEGGFGLIEEAESIEDLGASEEETCVLGKEAEPGLVGEVRLLASGLAVVVGFLIFGLDAVGFPEVSEGEGVPRVEADRLLGVEDGVGVIEFAESDAGLFGEKFAWVGEKRAEEKCGTEGEEERARFLILGGNGCGGRVWRFWLGEDSEEKGDGESVGWDVEIKIDK